MITKEPEKFFTKNYVVCVGAIICCILWGSAFPCVKIGYKLFEVNTDSVPSLMLFAGTRFSLAGILVIIFGCILKRKFIVPKPKNLWRVGVVSVFQTVAQYTFFYIGLAHTAGVKASVLNGLGVFFTILAACFIFRTEKFTRLYESQIDLAGMAPDDFVRGLHKFFNNAGRMILEEGLQREFAEFLSLSFMVSDEIRANEGSQSERSRVSTAYVCLLLQQTQYLKSEKFCLCL